MTAQGYQELIMEGVKGLPPEILAEVADFVYFVRQRVSQSRTVEDDLRNAMLRAELRQFSCDEEAHLEKEFANYEQLNGHDRRHSGIARSFDRGHSTAAQPAADHE